jgi:DNA mismatch repair protein MSH4
MWLLCPSRVREFSVSALSGSRCYNLLPLFSIHDNLLTRLSNDDDMEKNLSTFANEMASIAMILGLASSQSLVLIDELGRATSPKEGVGISHAIAEELIKLKVSPSHRRLASNSQFIVLHILCYVR